MRIHVHNIYVLVFVTILYNFREIFYLNSCNHYFKKVLFLYQEDFQKHIKRTMQLTNFFFKL